MASPSSPVPDTAPSAFDGRGLLMLAAASFLSMVAMRLCDPLLPRLAESFAASTGEAARTISAYAIAYGLLQLVYGPLADRYGKFRVIAVAVAVCAATNAYAALADSLNALVWARTLSGAAAAGIIPMSLAWVGDSVSYERRQEVLAHIMTATLLGTACGQWMSGLLAESWGWRWAFALVAALFLLAAATMLPASRRRGRAPGTAAPAGFFRGVKTVLGRPWARRVLGLTAIQGAFAFSAMAFIPAYLNARFGLSLNWAAAIVALFALSGLAYTAGARWLIAHLGETGLARVGGLVLGGAYIVIALVPHWIWTVPACALAGLGFVMLHATLQTHATQMAPEVRGTAVSLFGASLFMGQSVGVFGVALLVDHVDYRAAFLLSGIAIALLGTTFAAWLRARAAAERGATVTA